MSGRTLRSLLADLDLREHQWATLCAVHPNTVSAWILNQRAVPGAVASYARLLHAEHARKAKEATRKRRSREAADLRRQVSEMAARRAAARNHHTDAF